MLKGSDIIGKVVVTYDTGKKIERIRDLIFDQERNQLLGFLVEEKGLSLFCHSGKSIIRENR